MSKPRNILLRSGNPPLSYDRLDSLADEIAAHHEHTIVYADFFDQIHHVIRQAHESNDRTNIPTRPVQDAAEEVAATALALRAMLEELSQGWLWQFLTLPPPDPKA